MDVAKFNLRLPVIESEFRIGKNRFEFLSSEFHPGQRLDDSVVHFLIEKNMLDSLVEKGTIVAFSLDEPSARYRVVGGIIFQPLEDLGSQFTGGKVLPVGIVRYLIATGRLRRFVTDGVLEEISTKDSADIQPLRGPA